MIRRYLNYEKFTLFMSFLAHEYKRLGLDEFNKKYKNHKYKGIYKNYLEGYLEYINNKNTGKTIQCTTFPKVLIVEPYVYTSYFKHKNKGIIIEELPNAIPEFLKKGMLITKIQESIRI